MDTKERCKPVPIEFWRCFAKIVASCYPKVSKVRDVMSVDYKLVPEAGTNAISYMPESRTIVYSGPFVSLLARSRHDFAIEVDCIHRILHELTHAISYHGNRDEGGVSKFQIGLRLEWTDLDGKKVEQFLRLNEAATNTFAFEMQWFLASLLERRKMTPLFTILKPDIVTVKAVCQLVGRSVFEEAYFGGQLEFFVSRMRALTPDADKLLADLELGLPLALVSRLARPEEFMRLIDPSLWSVQNGMLAVFPREPR